MLRKLLLTWLCLALILPAGAVSPAPACAMAAEMAALAAAGNVPADAELPDCCQPLDVFLRTGQACQGGQDCGAAVPVPALIPHLALVVARSTSAAPALLCTRAPSGPPIAGIWRPPQA